MVEGISDSHLMLGGDGKVHSIELQWMCQPRFYTF